MTPEQIRLFETANPAFRERHVESQKPGELLCQDTFYVGHLKGIGKLPDFHDLEVFVQCEAALRKEYNRFRTAIESRRFNFELGGHYSYIQGNHLRRECVDECLAAGIESAPEASWEPLLQIEDTDESIYGR